MRVTADGHVADSSNDQRITETNNRCCCIIETCMESDPDDGNPRGNRNRVYRFPGGLKQMLWDSCGDQQIMRDSRENKTNFPVVLCLKFLQVTIKNPPVTSFETHSQSQDRLRIDIDELSLFVKRGLTCVR